jgi:hypothetical protein
MPFVIRRDVQIAFAIALSTIGYSVAWAMFMEWARLVLLPYCMRKELHTLLTATMRKLA